MLSLSVMNGLADCCPFIIARLLERLTWQGREGRAIVPTRFGGVGAGTSRRNSAVFLCSRDRGSEDAVVFPGIGEDGYFDYRGWAGKLVYFVFL